MRRFETPCFADLAEEWLCSNDCTFAIIDGFPVSPAHIFVTTHSIVETRFGASNEEQAAEEIGWSEAPGTAIKPGMFIARVRGHSMEPKIKDGSWNLFRPCPAGSREGRILLVQFNSTGDPENGGHFTVKRYHSAKTVSEDAWQHDCIELLPLNPAYDPISISHHEAPEMVVVGEWVSSID